MSLARRSVTSSFHNVLSHGAQVAILLVRSVLLARYLGPGIYGAYGYVQALVAMTRVIPSFGMGTAYVHRSEETEGEGALGVFLLLITVTTTIWGMALLAWGSSWSEEGRRLALWVLVPATLAANLAAPAQGVLTREVALSRQALIDLIRVIVTTLIALVLARLDAGIWALLSIDIVGALILLGGLYLVRPVWRPRFHWSPRTARYLLSYGGRTLTAGLLGQGIDRVDDLWAGWALGDKALGLYSRAYAFANYPRRVLASPVNGVALGTYAEARSDRKMLSRAFFRVNALLVRVGFLAAGAFFLVSPEFVRYLLGNEWTPMIGAFRMMLVYTAIDPIKYTVGHLFSATGEPQRLAAIRLAQIGVLVAGCALLAPVFGIVGIAGAATLMALVGLAILLWQAQRLVDFSVTRLFGPPLLSIGAGLALAYVVGSWMGAHGEIVAAGGRAIVFVAVYGACLLALEREQLIEMARMVRDVSRKQGAVSGG